MSPQARIKHDLFATKVMLEMKSPSEAYAEVYNRDVSDRTTRVNASRLLTHADVQERMEELSNVYKGLAEWALTEQIALTLSSTTPASVKNQIYEAIQTRAGYSQTKRIHSTVREVREYPDLNLSTEQLKSILNQTQ